MVMAVLGWDHPRTLSASSLWQLFLGSCTIENVPVLFKWNVIHQHGRRPSDGSEAEYVTLVIRMKIQ